ncbi:SDR family oxidoreductase [Cyanobium sp. Morenito 9A2]|uniref:SDR family oxidoreductase n=1 Tax=Cyanobium sp. Morenito 9A2 TaxID=2823718 RepID=UPI0020CE46A4|nr:SDR family oxidoreductase [Cyanobium sp. Morenito 9A2]MCP9849821.1 AMP-binding protein [Cyanobium sp. Morenito 9A2]
MSEATIPLGLSGPSVEGPDPSVTARVQAPGLSCEEIIDTFLSAYGERPALAERAHELRVDPATGATRREILPEFRAITYRMLHERVRAMAMVWRSDPDLGLRPGETVGILGFASLDYAVIDLSLAYVRAVPAPLSGHHTASEYDAILLKIAPAALAVSIVQLPAAVDLVRRHAGIRGLIVFDADPRITAEQTLLGEAQRQLREAGSPVTLRLLQSLLDRGHGDGFEFSAAGVDDPEVPALLIHTSGSTGHPKGACISTRALINTWRTVTAPFPKIVVVLAPFHHMMGRDAMISALNSGGIACFTLRPDLSTVFEDIQLVRPTALVLFPRLCEWIDQHVQSIRARTSAPEPSLRCFLGDRLQSIVVASAPLAPRLRALMADTFQVPVHEGYSSTETASGGLAMDGLLNRRNVIEYRLRDVPESGYFLTDRPFPRGELCVKTRFGIRQYFNNPEATAELFDAEGFSCTGDVVEERAPNRIAIIDRRKNVIKLSQGEFVAVGALEQLFVEACTSVRQIHVHGDSSRSYLLAVVVPDQAALERWAQPPMGEAEWIALLRHEVLEVARERGLQSFEIPRDFILATEPFSHENGLLTSLGKPIRPAIRQRYLSALDELYGAHDSHGRTVLQSLRHPEAELTVEGRLLLLLSSSLGVQGHDELQTRSFRELGGDSLGAAQLSVQIEELFGVSIEGSQILGPGGTVAEWARIIRADPAGPTPALPGERGGRSAEARELRAEDVAVERLVDRAILHAVAELPPGSWPVQSVFLTGASGFLGGRVCLAWLERLSTTGGRLFCLVRPSQRHSALERLEARFAHYDSATALRFRTLAGRHLKVLAGDITEPLCGLEPSTYARVAHEVDAICHCAALVNHRLAYRHVVRPNVSGTAEIVRLAMAHRRKSINFVSTVAVGGLRRPSGTPSGEAPWTECIRLDDSYANGYAASKWACEQLLRSTHAVTGLPVRIVRPELILPDRRLAGDMNQHDIFCRLIYSILRTGLAPLRFSGPGPDGEERGFRARGLPVDQWAEAIVSLAASEAGGFNLLDLAGPSDGLFPLEALVDGMAAAGCPLERLASYDEWLDRIEQALLELPAPQQALSLLDVLEAYGSPLAPAAPGPGEGASDHSVSEHWGGDLRASFPADYLAKVINDFAVRGLIDSLARDVHRSPPGSSA